MALPYLPRSLRNMGSAVLGALGSRRREDAPPSAVASVTVPEVAREIPQANPQAGPAPLSKEWLSKLAKVGNALWRLRRRLTDPHTGRPTEAMRRPFRDLESAWDALQEAGVEIRDHTGDDYDAGYALVCLAFQPTPGLRRERVIETLKPTITIAGQLVQMGEIIVGIPDPAQSAAGEPGA